MDSSQAIANSETSTLNPDLPVHEIVPAVGALDLKELFEYRELLFFLVWRDVKVRYKQTVLGASWAVLQPFLTMIVFSLLFGKMANISSDGVPYSLFSYAGLLPWTFFATGLAQASNSLVGSSNLLRKIYFPRVVIPFSAVLGGAVDLALAFLVLIPMMLYYGVFPGIAVLTLPLFALLACVTALGIGLWLSALNVEFRDVRYVVPFLVQIWLFISPVIYPASTVAAKLAENDLPPWLIYLYGLNPMAGVLEGFRWALLGTDTNLALTVIPSTIMALLLLISGVFYFRRMEKTFADRV